MKNEKLNTVFIVGAGASVPYSFPTSRELRKELIENFADKFAFIYKVKDKFDKMSLNTKLKDIKNFQKRFNLSSIYSVDYFMSRNPKYLDMGKEAIIIHLLEYERNCKFRENAPIDNADWYSYLYNYMIADLRNPESFPRISQNKFTFITFNYERSLEYFLVESIGHSFEGITNQKLKEVISSIPIIHIYGKISNLPLNEKEEGLKFGSTIHFDDLNKLRENIKTISDQIREISDHISEIVFEAERIFFLGFGYDKINLSNLDIPASIHSGQKIYGTTYGFNDRFVDDLKEYFVKGNYINQHKRGNRDPELIDKNNLIFEDVDSLTLLKNYL